MTSDPFSPTSSTALDPNVQGSSFTSVNTTADPYGFKSIESNPSASSFAAPLVAGPNLQVISPDAVISNTLQNRLVFSTVNEQVRAPKTLTLRNTGSQTLRISGLSFGDSQEKANAVRPFDHQRGDDFSLVNVPQTITIAPGASTSIRVQFIPQRSASLAAGDSPTHTVNAENYASLTINSNDPSGPTKVNLAGLNSTNYESDFEASLAEIVRSFGWTTDIGSEDNRLGLSKTLFGDEVYSPYWVRANASQPVELWPLAVYSSRTDSTHDTVRFAAKTGSGGNSGMIYSLAGQDRDDNVPGSNNISGGENQKLLPKILVNNVNTLPTSSNVDFNPTRAFALQRGDGFTNDNLNGPNRTRAWRIFPLRGANGVVVPNTFIATTDIGTAVGRNGDFNDGVYLFKNVRPESRALNTAVASLVTGSSDLTFNNNTSQSSLFNINPSSTETPEVTNTAGISSDNTLVNSLRTTFNYRASEATILTKLHDPNNLNPDFIQGGRLLGTDDGRYINLVAQAMSDGSLALKPYAEGSNVSEVTDYDPLSNFLTALKPLFT